MGESSLHDLSANQRKQNSQATSLTPVGLETRADTTGQLAAGLLVPGRGRAREKVENEAAFLSGPEQIPREPTCLHCHIPRPRRKCGSASGDITGGGGSISILAPLSKPAKSIQSPDGAGEGALVRPVRAHCGIEWTPYGRAPTGSDIMSPPWLDQVPPRAL